MSEFWKLFFTAMISLSVLSGCGSTKEDAAVEEKVSASKKKETKENNEKTDVDDKKEEEKAEEAAAPANNSGEFSELVSYMEKETEGTANILYENKEKQVQEIGGVSVSLDAYTLVELSDFHTDFSIPFDGQTDGGVVIAQYTVKNELDKDVYYMPSFYLSFTGAQKAYNNYKDLLPEEQQIAEKLSPSGDYLLKAGESVTGFYTYPFGKDQLKSVLEVSTAAVEVPSAHSVKGDFSSAIGKDGQFTLSLSEEGSKKAEANKAFYNDKVTSGDMGQKKMLKEEKNIAKNEQLGNVTVTLDGYQFTEFTPNAVEAPRFKNFKNGIVLLTVKFNLDNKGSEAIGLSSISSKLTVNDGLQYMLSEGMLLDYGYNDLIDAGKSGELLQIFLLDQEQYEKIWKDKTFQLEIGPMKNQEAKDISKGKRALFEL